LAIAISGFRTAPAASTVPERSRSSRSDSRSNVAQSSTPRSKNGASRSCAGQASTLERAKSVIT
jgi:hypothetical protein